MILSIIINLIVIAVIIISYNIYEEYRMNGKNNIFSDNISFKQAYDLTTLPIIIFQNNGAKYNFLLDTGSTDSHINKKVLETTNIKYSKSNKVKEVFGMEGTTRKTLIINIALTLNDKEFEGEFLVNDLSAAFDNVKKTSGVNLDGIIGTSFLEKYKYVIDFQKYIAYPKK